MILQAMSLEEGEKTTKVICYNLKNTINIKEFLNKEF